jgi:3-oxoadipate enol-lactonase
MPTTRNGDCELWYECAGEGPALLMVYGIGGNSRRWWTEFPARLARRYRVVTLDNRGTGRSDRPKEPWTMGDMAADVFSVAEAVGLERFHLLGCSLGSIIARHAAAAAPERILSLSLLCPPDGTPATPEDMALGVMWDPAAPRVESERKSWAVVQSAAFIRDHEARLLEDFELAEAERTPGRTFRLQLDAVAKAGDANAVVAGHTYPVHIVHGTADRLVPPENARTLAAAIPRARLTWLEGDSHNFWQHDPERSAAVVLDFLDSAEASP